MRACFGRLSLNFVRRKSKCTAILSHRRCVCDRLVVAAQKIVRRCLSIAIRAVAQSAWLRWTRFVRRADPVFSRNRIAQLGRRLHLVSHANHLIAFLHEKRPVNPLCSPSSFFSSVIRNIHAADRFDSVDSAKLDHHSCEKLAAYSKVPISATHRFSDRIWRYATRSRSRIHKNPGIFNFVAQAIRGIGISGFFPSVFAFCINNLIETRFSSPKKLIVPVNRNLRKNFR